MPFGSSTLQSRRTRTAAAPSPPPASAHGAKAAVDPDAAARPPELRGFVLPEAPQLDWEAFLAGTATLDDTAHQTGALSALTFPSLLALLSRAFSSALRTLRSRFIRRPIAQAADVDAGLGPSPGHQGPTPQYDSIGRFAVPWAEASFVRFRCRIGQFELFLLALMSGYHIFTMPYWVHRAAGQILMAIAAVVLIVLYFELDWPLRWALGLSYDPRHPRATPPLHRRVLATVHNARRRWHRRSRTGPGDSDDDGDATELLSSRRGRDLSSADAMVAETAKEKATREADLLRLYNARAQFQEGLGVATALLNIGPALWTHVVLGLFCPYLKPPPLFPAAREVFCHQRITIAVPVTVLYFSKLRGFYNVSIAVMGSFGIPLFGLFYRILTPAMALCQIAIGVALSSGTVIALRAIEARERQLFLTVVSAHCARCNISLHVSAVAATAAAVAPKYAATHLRGLTAAVGVTSPLVEGWAATVGAAGIADFSHWATGLLPARVVATLHALFATYDTAARRFGVDKVGTFGDVYVVAAGLSPQLSALAQAVLRTVEHTHNETAQVTKRDPGRQGPLGESGMTALSLRSTNSTAPRRASPSVTDGSASVNNSAGSDGVIAQAIREVPPSGAGMKSGDETSQKRVTAEDSRTSDSGDLTAVCQKLDTAAADAARRVASFVLWQVKAGAPSLQPHETRDTGSVTAPLFAVGAVCTGRLAGRLTGDGTPCDSQRGAKAPGSLRYIIAGPALDAARGLLPSVPSGAVLLDRAAAGARGRSVASVSAEGFIVVENAPSAIPGSTAAVAAVPLAFNAELTPPDVRQVIVRAVEADRSESPHTAPSAQSQSSPPPAPSDSPQGLPTFDISTTAIPPNPLGNTARVSPASDAAAASPGSHHSSVLSWSTTPPSLSSQHPQFLAAHMKDPHMAKRGHKNDRAAATTPPAARDLDVALDSAAQQFRLDDWSLEFSVRAIERRAMRFTQREDRAVVGASAYALLTLYGSTCAISAAEAAWPMLTYAATSTVSVASHGLSLLWGQMTDGTATSTVAKQSPLFPSFDGPLLAAPLTPPLLLLLAALLELQRIRLLRPDLLPKLLRPLVTTHTSRTAQQQVGIAVPSGTSVGRRVAQTLTSMFQGPARRAALPDSSASEMAPIGDIGTPSAQGQSAPAVSALWAAFYDPRSSFALVMPLTAALLWCGGTLRLPPASFPAITLQYAMAILGSNVHWLPQIQRRPSPSTSSRQLPPRRGSVTSFDSSTRGVDRGSNTGSPLDASEISRKDGREEDKQHPQREPKRGLAAAASRRCSSAVFAVKVPLTACLLPLSLIAGWLGIGRPLSYSWLPALWVRWATAVLVLVVHLFRTQPGTLAAAREPLTLFMVNVVLAPALHYYARKGTRLRFQVIEHSRALQAIASRHAAVQEALARALLPQHTAPVVRAQWAAKASSIDMFGVTPSLTLVGGGGFGDGTVADGGSLLRKSAEFAAADADDDTEVLQQSAARVAIARPLGDAVDGGAAPTALCRYLPAAPLFQWHDVVVGHFRLAALLPPPGALNGMNRQQGAPRMSPGEQLDRTAFFWRAILRARHDASLEVLGAHYTSPEGRKEMQERTGALRHLSAATQDPLGAEQRHRSLQYFAAQRSAAFASMYVDPSRPGSRPSWAAADPNTTNQRSRHRAGPAARDGPRRRHVAHDGYETTSEGTASTEVSLSAASDEDVHPLLRRHRPTPSTSTEPPDRAAVPAAHTDAPPPVQDAKEDSKRRRFLEALERQRCQGPARYESPMATPLCMGADPPCVPAPMAFQNASFNAQRRSPVSTAGRTTSSSERLGGSGPRTPGSAVDCRGPVPESPLTPAAIIRQRIERNKLRLSQLRSPVQTPNHARQNPPALVPATAASYDSDDEATTDGQSTEDGGQHRQLHPKAEHLRKHRTYRPNPKCSEAPPVVLAQPPLLEEVEAFGDDVIVAGPFWPSMHSTRDREERSVLAAKAMVAVCRKASTALQHYDGKSRSPGSTAANSSSSNGSVTGAAFVAGIGAGSAHAALLGWSRMTYRLLGVARREATALLSAAPVSAVVPRSVAFASPAFRRVHDGFSKDSWTDYAFRHTPAPAEPHPLQQPRPPPPGVSIAYVAQMAQRLPTAADASCALRGSVAPAAHPPTEPGPPAGGTLPPAATPEHGAASSGDIIISRGTETFTEPLRWRVRGVGVLKVSAIRDL